MTERVRERKREKNRTTNTKKSIPKKISQTDPEREKMDIHHCPESGSKKRVIVKELVEGQEAATQLKFLLENPFGGADADSSSLSLAELVANVLRSFTEALSIITSYQSNNNLLNSSGENGSPVTGDSTSDKRKRSMPPARKGGRGCYKRRKSAETWTTVSHTTHDNHAWRKYGQKEILNSEFPRSYFRCTYKYDEGCSARKQVQQTKENPDMYQTMYIGIHTCKATPKAKATTTHDHDLVTNSISSTCWESYLETEVLPPSEVQDHNISSSTSLAIKQEYPKEEHTPNDHKPLKMESDIDAAVYNSSSTGSDKCLVMDFGVESVHFCTDLFHFDESQLMGI